MAEIEKCRQCGRPFYVTQIGGQMPGTKEREDIICPHCRYTTTEISNGSFNTSSLSLEAEAKWLTEQRKSK